MTNPDKLTDALDRLGDAERRRPDAGFENRLAGAMPELRRPRPAVIGRLTRPALALLAASAIMAVVLTGSLTTPPAGPAPLDPDAELVLTEAGWFTDDPGFAAIDRTLTDLQDDLDRADAGFDLDWTGESL